MLVSERLVVYEKYAFSGCSISFKMFKLEFEFVVQKASGFRASSHNHQRTLPLVHIGMFKDMDKNLRLP